MIVDAQDLFDDVAAITVTRNSTNVRDLGIARDIGAGRVPFLLLEVGTAFTAAGAATLDIQLVMSAAAALTSPTVLWDSGAIGKATLIAGYLLQIPIPRVATPLQFLGVIYTVATGPMTAGTLSAFLSDGGRDNRAYASGFAVG